MRLQSIPAVAAGAVVLFLIGLGLLIGGVFGFSAPRHHPAATRAAPARGAGLAPGGQPLAAQLEAAQREIDDPGAPAAALDRAALIEQLGTRELGFQGTARRNATLGEIAPAQRTAIRLNVAAGLALTGLGRPPTRLPRWRIIDPPAAVTLLGDFRAAGARYRIRWQLLAGIALIETRFGRVDGVSTAGAAGPMQFMPASWRMYGHGDIHDPRQAILAAARLLVAGGVRHDVTGALLHYNESLGYAHAVEDYAAELTDDPRSFQGLYRWQVLYGEKGNPVFLLPGYPRVRPIPVRTAARTLTLAPQRRGTVRSPRR